MTPEPMPTPCKGSGCNADVPARMVAGCWVQSQLCPSCEASRPAPAAPPGPPPKPADKQCVNFERCGGLVEHQLHKFGSRLGWLADLECVECRKRALVEAEAAQKLAAYRKRLAASRLPERYHRYRFDRVLVQGTEEDLASFTSRVSDAAETHLGITRYNHQLARELREWSPSKPGVYLTGPVGGGKTTLIAALLTRLMWMDVGVLYLSESTLYDSVRRGMRAERGQPVEDLEGLACTVRVLALDDLGTTEALASWQRDLLERIIAARYDAGKPILVTSNLRISDIGHLHSERVASRLAQMCGRRQYELVGFDWRTGHVHTAASSPEVAPPKPVQTSLPLKTTPTRDYKLAASGEKDED